MNVCVLRITYLCLWQESYICMRLAMFVFLYVWLYVAEAVFSCQNPRGVFNLLKFFIMFFFYIFLWHKFALLSFILCLYVSFFLCNILFYRLLTSMISNNKHKFTQITKNPSVCAKKKKKNICEVKKKIKKKHTQRMAFNLFPLKYFTGISF